MTPDSAVTPHRPPEPAADPAVELAALKARVNILIVDDEARNLDVLESILYSPHYHLVRATSANEALLHLVDGDFAALILDVNMPVTNGIELAELIKQRRRTRHIPILFLTAFYSDEKFILEGYDVGAVDYMTKPINPKILRAKVSVFVDIYRLNRALTEANAALGREITQRQAAEESLRRVNQELEARVLSRTDELTAANSALRSSEHQLRLIADHASVFLAHVDRDHRFRFVNRAFAERFGFSADEVVGVEMSRVMGTATYEKCRHHLDRALAGERVEFEVENVDGRGGPYWLQVVYDPERSATGDVSGVVAVVLDVTARKRAEAEMLRARDEAMAASGAKDEFLAALSHELRTPLNPVLLVASAAAADIRLPAEVREDFALIAKNALLEARLIDDLLDLTRISRGKLTLDLRKVDVHQVLNDALGTVRSEFVEKRIDLTLELGAVARVADADSARLQQVFWNVLKNAIKFTAPGGSVRVETRSVTDSNEMTVTVTDSGIGMSAAELKRVFQPFAQGEHATRGPHRFGGLGLGLSISRYLMEMHGGQVHAFSPGPGKGSTFVIRIPLPANSLVIAPVEPAAAGTEPGVADDVGAPRIPLLLVEDHGPTRLVLSNLLRQRRYAVVSTDTVAEALRLAAGQSFELVVSDLGLPDGTGYELMAQLAQRYGLKGIALSGYGMEQDIARSREAGFVGHITKPVTFQALEKALDRLHATVRGNRLQASRPPVAP
ncbi:MAG TPA: response regulator [Opitutaceae bacterium]|nr:response regulator [Opitutaceae bacterium]